MTVLVPIRFVAPNGDHVVAVPFTTRADLPVFDIEVVRDARVVEYLADVAGCAALMALAGRRGWRES